MNEQLQAIDRVSDTVTDLAIRFGPKVLAALLILAAGFIVGRWAGRIVGRALGRLHLDPPVRSLLERIVRLFVLGLFLIMALQNLGVELLPLVAGLGVAGAAVALAMQGVLGNVAAGLTIIFTRPFGVGDYISIVKEEGEVLDISLFNTVLGHADKSRVVIPNRKIVGEILHNYGKIRQLALQARVSYAGDAAAAIREIDDVLRASPLVLPEPAPAVGVERLDDSCVTIGIAPWVKAPDYVAAVAELNLAVLKRFRSKGIEMPVPQREIRVVSATAGLRDSAGERAVGRDVA